MKKLLTQSAKAILLLLVMVVFVQANAQKRYAPLATGDWLYTIENDVQVSPTEMQFDLYVKDTDGSSPNELAIIQAGILGSLSIKGTGTLSTAIVTGFSDLVLAQRPSSALYATYGTGFQIKMTAKPGPGCGAGTTISSEGLGTRVTRIKIVNTVPFVANSQASLSFTGNTGSNPYPTKVFEYISCVSTEVIPVKTAGPTYQNIHLNAPVLPNVYNVTGGGSYCVGGAGLPVGLDGSETGVTYTLYQDLLPTATTFAGTGAAFVFTPNQLGTHTYTVKATGPGGTVDMTGSAVITEIVCTPTWSGLVSTGWYNPNNWVGNTVPLPTDDVIIPVGCPNYPLLIGGTTTYCHNLEISGFGSKAAPLAPGFTISGVLMVSGNLTITSSGTLSVGTGGALTVDGNLYINGGLTIQSQGSLITNGTVTGTATIQRNITANLGWHLLSSPVVYQEICNGDFAPTPANFPGDIQTWDFYKWLANCPTPPEPAERWRNLRTLTGSISTEFGAPPQFVPTRGYLVAYGAGWPLTHSFVGTPNTGDKVCSFFDIFTECTWDLVGNPFPSAIDWNQVTDKANLLYDYYWVWNENKAGGPGYEWWKDGGHQSSSFVNGYIPAEQGFFVKVKLDGGKTLGLPNSARVHNVLADYWLKDAQANKLTIKLGNSTNYDEAFVMFENNSVTGLDRNDAEKLFSMATEVPQVYTIVNNDLKTALNSLPYAENGITIPVGFVAPSTGSYSISVTGIENFSSLTGLVLEDKEMNYTQNLLQNPVYNFTASGVENAERFVLKFAGPIGIGEKNNSTINIYSNEKSVYVTCAAGFRNAQVTISNLLGQEITTQKLNDQPVNQINVNALKGYYLVKVQSESSVKTAKVYIN